MSVRYALYFAPATNTLWWQSGCRWLGRNPESGAVQPELIAETVPRHRELTHSARRYGFHATLKAPFNLAPGVEESDLIEKAKAFAGSQAPLRLTALLIGQIGNFLALQAPGDAPALSALALRCVRDFDPLRAPPDPADMARRRSAGLTARQETLLLKWGYPFTEEAFRFHLTLSDHLGECSAEEIDCFRRSAEAHFATALATPLVVDNLSIFREAAAGCDFELIARMPFRVG